MSTSPLLAPHLRAAWRALAAWDVDAAAIERISTSENIVFRVDGADARRHALRLHRPGYHSLAELRSEQYWTAALARASVDAPIAVRTKRGDGYTPVALDAAGGEWRYAGLLEWVDGEPLHASIDAALEASPSSKVPATRFAALGAIMAAIHNHASHWPLPRGFVRPRLDADGFVGERPFWGRFWETPLAGDQQRHMLKALRKDVAQRLRALPTPPDIHGLIHADLHPGNVIVNGPRLHVIDFDDAAFGWHAYELAVAIHAYQDHPRRDDFLAALVHGYRQARRLDDGVVAQVPLFLLVRTLASIGWAATRRRHDRHRTATLLARVEQIAEAALTPTART